MPRPSQNEAKRLRTLRITKNIRDSVGRGSSKIPVKASKRNGHRTVPVLNHPCPCGGVCVPTTGAELYFRNVEFADRRYYHCPACTRRCGVHRGTWEPIGVPANEVERALRQQVHSIMDPLWQRFLPADAGLARLKVYEWLGRKLGLEKKDCHVGMMQEDMLRRALVALKERA